MNQTAPAPWTDDAIEAFIVSLSGGSQHTQLAYRRDLRKFARECARSLGEDAVDTQVLRGYLAALHRQGAASRSIARALSALRSYCEYLCARDRLRHNPTLGLHAPKGARRLPQLVDVEQTARLLARVPRDDLETRDLAMWELIYSCGLRVSELVSLDLDALDFAATEVRVRSNDLLRPADGAQRDNCAAHGYRPHPPPGCARTHGRTCEDRDDTPAEYAANHRSG